LAVSLAAAASCRAASFAACSAACSAFFSACVGLAGCDVTAVGTTGVDGGWAGVVGAVGFGLTFGDAFAEGVAGEATFAPPGEETAGLPIRPVTAFEPLDAPAVPGVDDSRARVRAAAACAGVTCTTLACEPGAAATRPTRGEFACKSSPGTMIDATIASTTGSVNRDLGTARGKARRPTRSLYHIEVSTSSPFW
jgi:hypothetical protein